MSNGGSSTDVKKRDPGEISAEDVHNRLGELQGLAANLFTNQMNINDKLINDLVPAKETSDKAEKVTNPRHFPSFFDRAGDISGVLYSIQRLQEVLLKHI